MEKVNKSQLGDRIRELRTAAGHTQDDLAALLEQKRQVVSYYENGTRTPNIEQIMTIAKAYNTTTDYLFGLSDVCTTDKDIQFICDYTGLDEKTVDMLHSRYNKYYIPTVDVNFDELVKICDDKDEVEYLSNLNVKDPMVYKRIKADFQNDFNDYKKAINMFIFSDEFYEIIKYLMNNINIERQIYKPIKILAGDYKLLVDIEDSLFDLTNVSSNMKDYDVNLFNAQNLFIDLCRNLTNLEIIKKTSNDFYSIIRSLRNALYSVSKCDDFSVDAFGQYINDNLSDDVDIAKKILKYYESTK